MIENIPRLHGYKIDLCLFRTDDEAITKYTKWITENEDILAWIGHNNKVHSFEAEKEWAIQRASAPNKYMFNIVNKSNELVGNCSLTVVTPTRNAVIGINIGEPSARDMGFGTEVIKLLIKFGFEELNLHNITLTANGDNKRAIHVYEKNGFKTFGIEKEAVWYKGHWSDRVHMQILEQEYMKIVENENLND